MTIILLLVFLVTAICLAFFKHIKACIVILVLTLICCIGIGNGLVPSLLLKPLQQPFDDLSEPQWKNRNAIVLLGAGTIQLPGTHIVRPTVIAYSRIYTAARLYFACVKSHNQCTLAISGGDALKTGRSEASVYRDALLDLGVSSADILLEANSLNTYKNAEYTSAILKQSQFDQIMLVTSGVHLKRALLYFAYFGIQAKPILADYLAPQCGLIPSGYNFLLTDFAMHEYLGIARLYIYDFLGWNYPRVAGK